MRLPGVYILPSIHKCFPYPPLKDHVILPQVFPKLPLNTQPDTVLEFLLFLIAFPQIQPRKMYYCPDFLVETSARGRIYAV